MVKKFTNGTWYKVDLLLDWQNQAVTVYVNNTQLASDKFFTNSKTTIKSANAIVLYNLTPGGRCRVRKLMACQDRCDSKFSYQFSLTYRTNDLYLCFRRALEEVEYLPGSRSSLLCLPLIVNLITNNSYFIHSM